MSKGEGLWQQLDRTRTIKVHTGAAGMKQISDAIHDLAIKQPLRERAMKALEKKKIDLNQHETLIKMIDSDDRENMVLAEAILDEKLPVQKNQNSIRHGNPIYSPRPQISKRKRGGIY